MRRALFLEPLTGRPASARGCPTTRRSTREPDERPLLEPMRRRTAGTSPGARRRPRRAPRARRLGFDERGRRRRAAASPARDQSSDQRSTSRVAAGQDEDVMDPGQVARVVGPLRLLVERAVDRSPSGASSPTTKQTGTSRGRPSGRSSRGSRSGPPRGTPAGRPSGSSSPSVDDASLAGDVPDGARTRRRCDASQSPAARMRRGRRSSRRTASTSRGRPSRSPSTRQS